MRGYLAIAHLCVMVKLRESTAPPLRVAALVCSLGLLLGSAGCSAFTDRTLVIIGDSITGLTAKVVEKRFSTSFEVTTNAKWGARVDEQLQAAELLAATEPDVVIINLGSNDALQDWPIEDTRAALLKMLALFKNADCVRFTTISTSMNQESKPHKASAETINVALQAIALAQRKRPQAGLVEWDSRIQSQGVAALTSDTIHPNDAGALQLVDAYADSLASCPG
jgi:lysophospholipase L1-like esterase